MSDWKQARMAMPRPGLAGWLRVGVRGAALAGLTYGGLLLLLAVRLFERPLCGANRPVSPFITQGVCRAAFVVMGIGYTCRGIPMQLPGALVANHGSWLDIFALNACQRIYFVSKSEVASWPGIGWLARATGTLFIARKGSEAKVQQAQFEARLRAGHRLLFFPEGTSTDTRRVLPFKSTLFAGLFSHGLDLGLHVQPVSVVYHAPPDADLRLYGWWADMAFASHLVHVLAQRCQGQVQVVFHEPVPVGAFADRKALAAYCERLIRDGHPHGAA